MIKSTSLLQRSQKLSPGSERIREGHGMNDEEEEVCFTTYTGSEKPLKLKACLTHDISPPLLF